jgi:hypothetical protein
LSAAARQRRRDRRHSRQREKPGRPMALMTRCHQSHRGKECSATCRHGVSASRSWIERLTRSRPGRPGGRGAPGTRWQPRPRAAVPGCKDTVMAFIIGQVMRANRAGQCSSHRSLLQQESEARRSQVSLRNQTLAKNHQRVRMRKLCWPDTGR